MVIWSFGGTTHVDIVHVPWTRLHVAMNNNHKRCLSTCITSAAHFFNLLFITRAIAITSPSIPIFAILLSREYPQRTFSPEATSSSSFPALSSHHSAPCHAAAALNEPSSRPWLELNRSSSTQRLVHSLLCALRENRGSCKRARLTALLLFTELCRPLGQRARTPVHIMVHSTA